MKFSVNRKGGGKIPALEKNKTSSLREKKQNFVQKRY